HHALLADGDNQRQLLALLRPHARPVDRAAGRESDRPHGVCRASARNPYSAAQPCRTHVRQHPALDPNATRRTFPVARSTGSFGRRGPRLLSPPETGELNEWRRCEPPVTWL